MARLLSVSLPDDLADETEELARKLGKTKSEVVREALRRHLQIARFAALQRYGRARAEVLGLGPEDTEALVDRRHLLPVGEHRGVRIMTPQALLAELHA
jgi:Arc/MetJ-type ribon-helix-helix transcriptional regulator